MKITHVAPLSCTSRRGLPQRLLSGMALALLLLPGLLLPGLALPESALADLDILVIGSTHSYSEGGDPGVVHEQAFSPANIAARLQDILDGDPGITETVNVMAEDVYSSRTLDTAIGNPTTLLSMEHHRYSLAQYYMWPEGRDARLRNLRGEDGTPWDYVVILEDSYVLANMPGPYAEGATLVADEVASGTATPLLLMQWPDDSSAFSAAHLGEVVYRVADSSGYTAVPAGFAWDSWGSKDSSAAHPTPDGAYLAAASIYSAIYNASASDSSFSYDDPLADHALATVQTYQSTTPYSGDWSFVSPFTIGSEKARYIEFSHTGTSSENGIRNGFEDAMERTGVSFRKLGNPPYNNAPIQVNYGRGNSFFEESKQYQVDPSQIDRSFGFPMQEHSDSGAGADSTLLHGIDKRYGPPWWGFDDGTDLGIGYRMIRNGQAAVNAGSIPIRLLWAKLRDADPVVEAYRDAWHMSHALNAASGTYLYTIVSGRCPVGEEPEAGTDDWYKWLGSKVGFETAWRVGTMRTRPAGFRVFPEDASEDTVTETASTALSAQFLYQPSSDVVAAVSSSVADTVIVNPRSLSFTASNHDTAQNVSVLALPGTTAAVSVDVTLSTTSADDTFDGHSDTWSFTASRSARPSVSYLHNNEIAENSFRNQTVLIDLEVAAATPGNTTFLGPNHGTLSWQGASVLYTPNTDYFGPDSFAFYVDETTTVTDGYVSLDIDPNSLPSAPDETLATDEGVALSFTLTATDPDLDPITYQITSGPTDGSLSGTAPNLTYTPDGGFLGTDTFTYSADDGVAGAATATVQITVYAHPGPADVTVFTDDGGGSLRDAITTANQAVGAASLILDIGIYTLSRYDKRDRTDDVGDLDVRGELTLIGRGPERTTIDAADIAGVLEVHRDATLTLQDLTLTGGLGRKGGAIQNYGTVVLNNVVIADNFAGQAGGAIYNRGTLTMTGGALLRNNGTRAGGGLWSRTSAVLSGVEIRGNTARSGGGIHADRGTVSLTDAVVADNTVDRWGAGAMIKRVELTSLRTDWSTNTAGHRGGAILLSGRAIANLTEDTLTGNEAVRGGGAIYNQAGTVNSTDVTMTANFAPDGAAVDQRGNSTFAASNLNVNGTVYPSLNERGTYRVD